MVEFVAVKDIDGQEHTIQARKIMRVTPSPRVDGYSFSPGHVLFLEDGGSVKVYEREGLRISYLLTAAD